MNGDKIRSKSTCKGKQTMRQKSMAALEAIYGWKPHLRLLQSTLKIHFDCQTQTLKTVRIHHPDAQTSRKRWDSTWKTVCDGRQFRRLNSKRDATLLPTGCMERRWYKAEEHLRCKFSILQELEVFVVKLEASVDARKPADNSQREKGKLQNLEVVRVIYLGKCADSSKNQKTKGTAILYILRPKAVRKKKTWFPLPLIQTKIISIAIRKLHHRKESELHNKKDGKAGRQRGEREEMITICAQTRQEGCRRRTRKGE